MSGPVCPTCGGPFGACSCVGKRARWRRTLREREPEVRSLLALVELGCALILVGVLTLLV